MKYLLGYEEKEAMKFLDEAVSMARSATCERSRCGSVIVKDGEIIGRGFNSPPRSDETQRRCHTKKDTYHKKVTDKTCCIHAEQRAITDSLKRNSDKIDGSRLYFVRLDNNGDKQRSGEPYCTICSKMALDADISEFVLWQDKGVCVYNTDEYNRLSFEYNEN